MRPHSERAPSQSAASSGGSCDQAPLGHGVADHPPVAEFEDLGRHLDAVRCSEEVGIGPGRGRRTRGCTPVASGA